MPGRASVWHSWDWQGALSIYACTAQFVSHTRSISPVWFGFTEKKIACCTSLTPDLHCDALIYANESRVYSSATRLLDPGNGNWTKGLRSSKISPASGVPANNIDSGDKSIPRSRMWLDIEPSVPKKDQSLSHPAAGGLPYGRYEPRAVPNPTKFWIQTPFGWRASALELSGMDSEYYDRSQLVELKLPEAPGQVHDLQRMNVPRLVIKSGRCKTLLCFSLRQKLKKPECWRAHPCPGKSRVSPCRRHPARLERPRRSWEKNHRPAHRTEWKTPGIACPNSLTFVWTGGSSDGTHFITSPCVGRCPCVPRGCLAKANIAKTLWRASEGANQHERGNSVLLWRLFWHFQARVDPHNMSRRERALKLMLLQIDGSGILVWRSRIRPDSSNES